MLLLNIFEVLHLSIDDVFNLLRVVLRSGVDDLLSICMHMCVYHDKKLCSPRFGWTSVECAFVFQFEVSHMQGAVWVGEDGEHAQEAVQTFLSAHPGGMVACYCSVGYRSSRLAELLLKVQGVNACNVEGSIFQWANEGKPVYKGEHPLQKVIVHPYNNVFGMLLDQNKRSSI